MNHSVYYYWSTELEDRKALFCFHFWPPADPRLQIVWELKLFLSDLVLRIDEVIIVDDFKIHVDVKMPLSHY